MENKNPKEINTHEIFENLFPIGEELLKKIEEDMSKRQYDHSQPVILATWAGQEEAVVIDGHTRLRAAIDMGIEEIPVFTHELDTEQEALELAIHLQCHRRNLTDEELMKYMEVLDRRGEVGRDSDTGQFTAAPSGARGKSAKAMADLLNTSPRKVERMRTIQDHADPETLKAVMQGEMSVNKGYNQTQEKRKRVSIAEKQENLDAQEATQSWDDETVQPAQDVDTADPGIQATEIHDSDTMMSRDAEECQHENREGFVTIAIPRMCWGALNARGMWTVEEHVRRAVYFYLFSDEEDIMRVLAGYDEDLFLPDDDVDEDDTSEQDEDDWNWKEDWDDDEDDPFGDIDD